jgi:hypothetical protein
MKILKLFSFIIMAPLLFIACSGGGGDTSDTGSVAMSITDAKPLLPENVERFIVEFSGVRVHKPGEGWIELPLLEHPYTIDLLQFQNGLTTEFIPPVELDSGKYTQVRFEVASAKMILEDSTEIPVEIPSEFLRTDKNITLDVTTGTLIDIVVHFDLGMSLVVSGTESEPVYKMKPVLHLFDEPLKAGIIDGSICNSLLDDSGAIISVYANGELYTQVDVPKNKSIDETPDPEATQFMIFWLVPNQEYAVNIDFNMSDNEANGTDYTVSVVEPDQIAILNIDCTLIE